MAGSARSRESKHKLTYDQFTTHSRCAYGTEGIIQNIWRELIAG
jgi:hypothetical protein